MTVFYLLKQLTKEYPEILTPENVWIIGVTREPSTLEYYLVFYHDVRAILNRFVRVIKPVTYMPYSDFYKIEEIGSGAYINSKPYTVHTSGTIFSTESSKNVDKR